MKKEHINDLLVTADKPRSRGGCKLAIVGEAPGYDEAKKGRPFVGRSGQLLGKVFDHIGLKREDCLITNVFSNRPMNNDEGHFFVKKSAAKKEGWHLECPYPVYGTAGYVSPDRVWELERLKTEITEAKPERIVALGACALWALTGESKIGAFRGSSIASTLVPGYEVIPTYHPANILRQFKNLPLMIADFSKAVQGDEDFPPRLIITDPTLEQMDEFYEENINPDTCTPPHSVAWDIETTNDAGGQITCIGFATRGKAIVVPFWSIVNEGYHYWTIPVQEEKAIEWVKKILTDDRILKITQNGPYDVQWVIKKWGIVPKGFMEDTMLMAHSLQPELRKGLGALVSMYLKAPAWKQMANFKSNKADA